MEELTDSEEESNQDKEAQKVAPEAPETEKEKKSARDRLKDKGMIK